MVLLTKSMNIMHTNGMKIAISIPADVFEIVEKMAKENKTSRSQIFVSAAREYIRRWETQQIIEKLNEVYSQPETREEQARRKAMSAYYRKRFMRKRSW
jgi:metal-responsive CopG/Arc/MetJ family transcriptional regulator